MYRRNLASGNFGVMGLIQRLRLDRITEWGSTSASRGVDTRVEGVPLHEANVATSAIHGKPGRHMLAIDIDVPAYLVPSSTPGHSHLYIDSEIPEATYFKLLDVLAEAHIIDLSYAVTSKEKGCTSLRLPWVEK